MDDSLRAQIHANLSQRETGELLEIWEKHDLDAWPQSTFDIIQEILTERQVELPPQNEPSRKRYSAEVAGMTDVEELKRSIKKNEAALIDAQSRWTAGWFPLIISLGIVVAMAIKIAQSGVYLLITAAGLLYVGFNVWRLYNADQQKKKTQARLKEYRDRLAEIQAA